MPVAVIARLDDEIAEAHVEKFADGLPDPRSGRWPLNITLATYPDDADLVALDDALGRAIRPWTQLSVSLVGFGVFPGQPSCIWMLPVPIHRLLHLHTEVDTALLDAAGRHCYEFGIWMPTVGIAETEDDGNFIEILVRLYDGPIDVMLDRIELVRTNPFEVISSRTLPG